MKILSSLMLLILLGASSVAPAIAQEKAADPKAEALRKLLDKFQDKVVTLTWSTKTSAMGQEIESQSSATGVLLGEKGLLAVSNQPFNAGAGLAGMFGRRGGGSGAAPGPENFKVHTQAGEALDAIAAGEDKAVNMRFYAAKSAEDKPLAFEAMPEKVQIPAIGEEVVIISAMDATLNFARFFKTARINSVIEEGKYYGLDGSIQDCLGGLVVTYAGSVLGVIGQKTSGQADASGGIGGMLGGMSDPAKMLGNRVLMTPAVFAAAVKTARDAVNAPDFGKLPPKPEAKPTDPKPSDPKPEEVPPVEEKKHNWRGLTRVITVNETVLKGKYGEAKGGIMVSAKPEADSMAAKSGLANGDLILKVGETEIAADCTVEKFWETIEKTEGVVKLTVARFGGKKYELEVHTK